MNVTYPQAHAMGIAFLPRHERGQILPSHNQEGIYYSVGAVVVYLGGFSDRSHRSLIFAENPPPKIGNHGHRVVNSQSLNERVQAPVSPRLERLGGEGNES